MSPFSSEVSSNTMSTSHHKGVIYILTNPSFPEYVKIGYANDLESRMKSLNKSETIPFAFRAYAVYDVDHRLTDKELHNLIDMLNPDLRSVETFNGKTRTKEFFAMSPEDAYAILEAIAKISGTTNRLHRLTPTGEQIEEEAEAEEIRSTTRKGPFRFSEVGIPIGAMLTFADNSNLVAEVVEDRKIRFDGKVTSLSRSAQDIKGFDHPVQGTLWWMYEGEKLSDRRDRLGK